MKHIFFIAVLALAVFAGCKKDDPEVEGVLTVSPASQDIGNTSGSFYISVQSNTDWTVYPKNGINPLSDFDVTPLSGTGDGTVKISFGSPVSSSDYASIYFYWYSFGEKKSTYVYIHR